MTENPVGWFEIHVSDMARAKAFYEGVFKTVLEYSPISYPKEAVPSGVEMWTFPWKKGATGITGALVKMQEVAPGAGGVTIYFSCKDCAEESARVLAHGGKIIRPKFSMGEWGFIAIAEDTEGNVIGLHSSK